MTLSLPLTKTDAALLELRKRLRTGQLMPGERIEPNAIASELGISLTPVREALRVLSADGLVQFHAHRGTIVSDTAERSVEIWQIRVLLEPWAVELAVPHLVGDKLKTVERLHASCVRSSHHPTRFDKNRDWHFAIYEPSQNPILLSFIDRLWELVPWRTVWAIPGRSNVSADEHEAIMSAIRSADAGAAAAAMRRHILSGLRSLKTDDDARSRQPPGPYR